MKIFRIIVLMICFVFFFYNVAFCKYVYIFEEDIIKLTRDDISPRCTVLYSTLDQTNENVIVTIESDKEIEQSSGFELSEDRKKMTKTVYVNESDIVIVKDLSGNCTEVEYNVNNIDKGQPYIIGVENNKKYKSPVKLEFMDDSEIESIFIDRYSDRLELEYHSEFLDSAFYKNIDRNSNSITVNVKEHPLNTKCYKYYLNDKLYITSSNTKYIYTGLEKGKEYNVKVEALDCNGNILDTQEMIAKTSFFEIIFVQKTDTDFLANIQNIDKEVKKIRYSINNFYNPDSIEWYDCDIVNNINVKFEKQNNIFYPAYMLNVYLYDKDEEILDVIQFLIDFNGNYVIEEKDTNEYELKQPGNYQIKVLDCAGNQTEYFIKVQ